MEHLQDGRGGRSEHGYHQRMFEEPLEMAFSFILLGLAGAGGVDRLHQGFKSVNDVLGVVVADLNRLRAGDGDLLRRFLFRR